MSNARLDSLTTRVSEAARRVIWAQWRSLGARLSGPALGEMSSAIDPEALLLGSLALFDAEPRLQDVVASWMAERSGQVSLQRVRNLMRSFPATLGPKVAAAAATAVISGKDHRWKALTGASITPIEARGKELFGAEGHWQPARIVLQLRVGIGVSVKADVLAYILATTGKNDTTWAPVATIAATLGYTAAGVRRAVDDLASAGFVDAAGWSAARAPALRMFRANREAWAKILGHQIPGHWARWDQHFAFTAALIDWRRETAERTVSDYAFNAGLRDLLDRYPFAFVCDDAERTAPPDGTDGTADYFDGQMTRWEGSMERNG